MRRPKPNRKPRWKNVRVRHLEPADLEDTFDVAELEDWMAASGGK